MSKNWPGSVISKTAPTPAGPYESDPAPGVWTLSEQAYWQQQGLWPIPGNVPPYIEDVFSTYLYTGNGGSSGAAIQFIPTGINLNTSGAKVFSITSGTSWVVPDDWNSSNNKIEVIGAGGCAGYGSGSVGSGGGGGAYSSITNLSLTPGATITLQVGKNQGYIGGGTGNKGTDTWFNGTSLASASVSAEAGYGGASTGAGGIGGRASVGVGSTKYSGGAGASKTLGGGGGGAAGPNGDGVSSTGNDGGDGDNGVGGTGGTSSSVTGGTGTQFPLSSGVVRGVGGGGWGGASGNGGYGGFAGGGGGSTDGDYYNVGQAADGIIIITYYSTESAGGDGLVWVKRRNGTASHDLTDTVTGVGKVLSTNSASAQYSYINTPYVTPDGFAVSQSNNNLNYTYGSWTFKQQSKFFDIVTWTGDGVAGREIAHNLGSTPGCIIVKCTSNSDGWVVQHRSLNTAAGQTIQLNSTAAAYTANVIWNSTAATDTVFTVGSDGSVNGSGRTYVAYLFAHDAGGFGDDGTENVISCGSFTTDGSGNASVNLGYEPQWLLMKDYGNADNWVLVDNMRGMPVGAANSRLFPNLTDAEGTGSTQSSPTATGFNISWNASRNYIYIAIRRGPMKTPTSGTEVFNVDNGDGVSVPRWTSGFPVDMAFERGTTFTDPTRWWSRLTGVKYLESSSTAAESSGSGTPWDYENGWYSYAGASNDYSWMFRRAPGFFDVVCYTGDGVGTYKNISHNLGVVPEIVIVKKRGTTSPWYTNFYNYSVTINSTNAGTTPPFATVWGDGTTYIAPTSSVFTVNSGLNAAGNANIAYLFATVPGVSKVGSYTGNASTNQIDCGFSSGARFVLIKRTDSTGDWYVYDSARGIVAGNDPYLLLNSTAAEVTSTDYVDTYSAGFELTSTAPVGLNASGGTYIFLAIA